MRTRVYDHDVFIAERGEGSGAPAVCVHSTGLSSVQWRRLARRLGKTRRVFSPDLIGYGETQNWQGEGPFETAADLEIVRHAIAMAGQPVHLVGHSYGGRLALLAAAEDPSRIVSMSLFEPVAFGVLRSTNDEAGLAELAGYDDGEFLDDATGGSEAWVERFVDYWNGPGAWAELGDSPRAAFMRSARKMFEEVRETSLDSTPHTAYAQLDMPVLLLSGQHSTVAGQRVCATLAATLPRATHHSLDTGHMGPLLAADEVNSLILAHVARAEEDPNAPSVVKPAPA